MIVLDTHAWIWWVSDSKLLGKAALREIAAARQIGVSAISLWEFSTLVEKGRIAVDRDPGEWMRHALELPKLELIPITPSIAMKSTQLGRSFHGDPADRLIVATAILESARLVTKDDKIQAYGAVDTVW